MNKFFMTPSKDSYSESLKYSTLIFRGVDGNETTRPRITNPKNTCKYSALAFFTEKHRVFLNGFLEGLTFKVLHPLWGRYAEVSAGNTGTTIYCNIDNSNFSVGKEIFLVTGLDTFDTATIVSIDTNSIEVDKSVTTTSSQWVLPTFYGIITGAIQSNYTGENYAMCTISIEELR